MRADPVKAATDLDVKLFSTATAHLRSAGEKPIRHNAPEGLVVVFHQMECDSRVQHGALKKKEAPPLFGSRQGHKVIP